MTEPTLPQNLTACRHFNSAALVKIVVVSVCQVGPLSSVDERAEHGLDHGFDGRIIDALGLRQLGRDGFEVAIACRWRQRHRSLAHDRELAVGQAAECDWCQRGSSRPNSSTSINMRTQLAPITLVNSLLSSVVEQAGSKQVVTGLPLPTHRGQACHRQRDHNVDLVLLLQLVEPPASR